MLEIDLGVCFQIVNQGGTFQFIFERLERTARHRDPDQPFPTDRLRHLWYDIASLGPRALETTIDLLGADRITRGSDSPIIRDNPLDAVRDARLTDTQKRDGSGSNGK